jgi:hypothetical protein
LDSKKLLKGFEKPEITDLSRDYPMDNLGQEKINSLKATS